MALSTLAITAYDWVCTALLAGLFSGILAFWYRLMRTNMNPHAWRKRQ